MAEDVIETLRATLPPVFAVGMPDDMTGGLLNGRTIQNKKCSGEIPSDVFFYSGRQLGCRRDALLDWYRGTLESADVPRPSGKRRAA